MRKLLFLGILFLAAGSVSAQFSIFKRGNVGGYKTKARSRVQFSPYSSVSLGTGTAHYYGEINALRKPISSTFTLPRWNFTADYTRHFNPKFSGRVGLMFARITADDYRSKDVFRNIRNLHFRNDIKEFSLSGIYRIVPEGKSYDHRPFLTPYIFAGVAVFAHNPKARTPNDGLYDNSWVALQPLGTEGQGRPGYAQPYSRVQVAFPFGLGFRMKYRKNWDLSLEAGLRYTITDHLDDIGGGYADPNDLLDNELSGVLGNRTLEQIAARKGGDRTAKVRQFLIDERGFPNDPNINPFAAPISGFADKGDPRGGGMNDIYLATSIKVSYLIPSQVKCPRIR